jgi:hypothetical protein
MDNPYASATFGVLKILIQIRIDCSAMSVLGHFRPTSTGFAYRIAKTINEAKDAFRSEYA